MMLREKDAAVIEVWIYMGTKMAVENILNALNLHTDFHPWIC